MISQDPIAIARPRNTLPEQAAEGLRRAIRDGRFATGRLPAEPSLASRLGISRATLRHAVSILEQEGLLSRRHGSGTFVVQPALELRNLLNANAGITDFIAVSGQKPGTTGRRVTITTTEPGASERLRLEADEPLVRIERTRTANARPVAHTTDYLPLSLLTERRIATADVEAFVASAESLYRRLRDIGVRLQGGVAEVVPARADESLARRLKVRAGSLLLRLDQVDFDPNGRPVLFSEEFLVSELLSVQVYRKGPG